MGIYVVATPKGGVGKSTTAAELVLALAQRRRQVLARPAGQPHRPDGYDRRQ